MIYSKDNDLNEVANELEEKLRLADNYLKNSNYNIEDNKLVEKEKELKKI